MRRALAIAVLTLAPRADADQLSFVSPRAEETLSGHVMLRAEVEPAALAAGVAQVSFTVDGELACRADSAPFQCAWDAGPEPLPRQLRAVATLHGGGRLVATLRTAGMDLSLGVAVDLVQVTATVTDHKGRLVRGLASRDFRVSEDGIPQQVSHFVPATEAREIVAAVDMSGSMNAAMPKVREAVKGFLGALRPDDHVTLLAFNDSIFTLARRETDPAARAGAVTRLSSWGGTALYDVILKGQQLLDQRRGRKALVVFSDGDDESSHATLEDVRKRAERSDAPVYLVGQGRGIRDPQLRKILVQLAAISGGRAFHTDDPEELQGVFGTIVDELESQYLLAYGSSNRLLDGSWRAIRVEAGPGRSVRARQGYRAEARR